MSYKEMVDGTVAEIREFYKNEEWFKEATDAQIIGAWSQRSEDSCASWLGFGGDKYGRDEAFEEYLKRDMAFDKLQKDGLEAPGLRARIATLEEGFKRLRRLSEGRKSGRDPGVALKWIEEITKEMLGS